MRRDHILPWLICTVLWIAIAVIHERLRVENSIGLVGQEPSQLGSLRFWLTIVAFPPAAILACLAIIQAVLRRPSSRR